ncbi:MAG: mannosyltransferase family protein [Myxococcota bacterium]
MRRLIPKDVLRDVVGPFVAHRLALTAAGLVLIQFIQVRAGIHTYLPAAFDLWVRWDAEHYLIVADRGYGAGSDSFFPLYPLLTRALGVAMPLPLAGLLVSNAAAVLALVWLYRWLREEGSPALARGTVWFAITFPTSFFLSAVYAESTYLACAVGTVWAWRRGRGHEAAGLLFLACLARPQGFIALTVPFVLGWTWRSRVLRQAPWFVLAAVPAAAVLLGVHYLSSGDPLGFLDAGPVQRMRVFWDAPPVEPPPFWRILWDEGLSSNLVRRLLNWSALGLVALTTVHWWRRGEVELGALTLLTVAVPFAFHASLFDAASMARYALIAFPVHVTLARWFPQGKGGRTVQTTFVMLQVVFFGLFAARYWAE